MEYKSNIAAVVASIRHLHKQAADNLRSSLKHSQMFLRCVIRTIAGI